MQELPQDTNKESDQDSSIRDHVAIYLRKWPWFVVSVLVAFIIVTIYLRYTPLTYSTTTTILLKNENSKASSELAAFNDLGLVDKLNIVDFENLKVVLKSKSLSEKVVDKLNLTVSYFVEGNILDTEIFDNKPFDVKVIKSNGTDKDFTGTFYFKPISTTQFTVFNNEREKIGDYTFGDSIELKRVSLFVTPNLNVLENTDSFNNYPEILVRFQKRDEVANGISAAINVSSILEMSSVLKLSLTSTIPEKSRAILDELVKQYNQDSMEDKNLVAQNTADFIQGRLEIITNELDSVETGKVDFKEENRLTSIEAESQIFLESASEINRQQIQLETQIALINTMMDYFKNSSEKDLLPANLGVGEESFAGEVDKYNQLILERNRLLQSSTTKNPMVVGLDQQIEELRGNVLKSMKNAKNNLRISLGEINKEMRKIGSEIYQIPEKEKVFRGISRQQEIKETLYLYLLQKREENAISLAVTAPKVKVVDAPYSDITPVAPNKKILHMGALFLGISIPFLIIYLGRLFDNKIRNRFFIESKSRNIPIVGEIPELGNKEEDLVKVNDTSILAESFRIMSTNLKYLMLNKTNKEEKGNVIFVTSTIKGEGKTFVSSNLAVTLAYGGAKVVLVGADIRNPQIQRYIDGDYNKSGVVEYLVYPDTTVEDYLQPAGKNKNLFLFMSGVIPPNPAELWMQDRAGELFKELAARFDYVVVDTAPAMLVADTILINKYADVTLYTLRAGYTEKNLMNFPIENKNNGKLNNISFVLNNVSEANFGYGNKYGYTYGQTKKTFWQKMFGK
ncbi:polysaccharide biosynthesis tyrosine autokinase [Aequorivita sp. 609]|uniref:GumC family protein n=1 Tax=Aequorivita TaxID=153265 RepID=UPI001622575E|nr:MULTISPECIES: polysaccharide biosynthesis tyrosine autokinase [Aequorivita]MBB6681551.1 polysaccharide biosynthesis tyrosine autokinase [Aequorivita sp. 609]